MQKTLNSSTSSSSMEVEPIHNRTICKTQWESVSFARTCVKWIKSKLLWIFPPLLLILPGRSFCWGDAQKCRAAKEELTITTNPTNKQPLLLSSSATWERASASIRSPLKCMCWLTIHGRIYVGSEPPVWNQLIKSLTRIRGQLKSSSFRVFIENEVDCKFCLRGRIRRTRGKAPHL